MASSREVTPDEHAFWSALRDRSSVDFDDLCEDCQLHQSKVTAIASQAEEAGLLTIDTRERQEVIPAEDAAEAVRGGLPERRAVALLAGEATPLAMPDFVQLMQKEGLTINEVIRWGKARGWLDRGKEGIVISEEGKSAAASETLDADEQLLLAADGQRRFLDEADDPARVETLLKNRPDLAKLRKRSQRTINATDAGKELLRGDLQIREERNTLTSEELKDGTWRNVTLRPFNVTLESQTVRPAKIHPLRKIIEETRRTFLEMGFTETASPMVESSFWNFDALFQPQDHPAREMQDTFYMSEPAEAALPADEKLVDAVKAVHEHGGETGSQGWGYNWDVKRSLQTVLRTHTTAATIRALSAHPAPPLKTFCVGWVFRNETITFKHLPVFHQVDGIVLDENANLASLLGILDTFYKKMGFSRVKFKPAFYPYTEPSVDVVVFHEDRGKWIEMGGSGIFRPEVTEPLGCKYPVLAWGLGMERLAMIRYEISDIRDLYRSDVDNMQGVPLCR